MKRLSVLLVVVMALFGFSTTSLMAQKKTPETQFAKMDKNGDKKLSLEEFLGKKQGDKTARQQKRFKALDTDNDGFLTLDELKANGKGKKRNGY